MKILVISPHFPWPLHGGPAVRIYNLIKHFSMMGHEIILLAPTHSNPATTFSSQLNFLCKKIYTYKLPEHKSNIFFAIKSFLSPRPYPSLRFQSKDISDKLKVVFSENNFDLVLVNFSFLVEMLPDRLNEGCKIILDQHESEEFVYRDYLKKGNFMIKIFSAFNILKIKNLYRKILPKINAILCVCDQEAELIRQNNIKGLEIIVAPNGVDADYFIQDNFDVKENNIVFCGNMSVRRNIEAVKWFANKVFPLVKEKLKDAQFVIAGKGSQKNVFGVNNIDSIKVLGEVEDIRDCYKIGKVFILPYHFGAGTRLKVFEAMASRIPIVSTSVGCRGINMENGKHVLIADNEKDFAEKILTILNNKNLSKKLSENAFNLAVSDYDWKEISYNLEKQILKLLTN